jgi:hypothetical protein
MNTVTPHNTIQKRNTPAGDSCIFDAGLNPKAATFAIQGAPLRTSAARISCNKPAPAPRNIAFYSMLIVPAIE